MLKHLAIALLLLGTLSCKKKDDEKKEEPAPVVTPSRANTMSARVNGNAWTVSGNNTASAKVEVSLTTNVPKQYVFIGRSETSMYKNAIWLYTAYATGTVDLRSSPGCSAIYFDATGQSFYIKSGSMTISTMDTSHVKSDKCDKFKASFSFVTDSVGGIGYTIDQGSIDFEAQ